LTSWGLRQRLARIETLTNVNLTQTEDWLPLHFAVKLARLWKPS
jgi:DNA-binding PucR family transcriptional regulator